MAIEIERKYLLKNNDWQTHVYQKTHYKQAYLANTKQSSVRIRIAGNKANINIKSMTLGIQRLEYEYPMPVQDANELLEQLCQKPVIEKTRHLVKYDYKIWEIDVFEGENKGLIMAEIELNHVAEKFKLPAWIGAEVSQYVRYYNVNLIQYPYQQWTKNEKMGLTK